jgi:hypothetical protein
VAAASLGRKFLKNVEQRKLNVDRILAIHGTGPEPWSEVVQTIKAKGSAPAATN